MELSQLGFLDELVAPRRDTWNAFSTGFLDLLSNGWTFDTFLDNPSLATSNSLFGAFSAPLDRRSECPFINEVPPYPFADGFAMPLPELHPGNDDPPPPLPPTMEDKEIAFHDNNNSNNFEETKGVCKVEEQGSEIPLFNIGMSDDGERKPKTKKLEGQPSKNLMAERRRRKRLNDRLSMLRSIVPKISKMDRTSILATMASAFVKLDDSPMFQKQLFSLEETTDELKDRCQKLYNGCKKFMTALGEAYNGEISFADSLEVFGGGQDDPVSVSIGGPVITKFITTLRELASFKELLRSQVEHVLVDRLTEFISIDLQDTKDSRRRFDKAVHSYDQSREKFVSLKKNTPEDVVAELEEDLQNSKSTFEKSRFNLVNSLMNIEAKKKYEFLESISAIMDAHLRYFKLGYDLLSQMEPYIHQVLTYAQQSKELANIEQDKLAKRIQEYRTQAELENIQVSSNFTETIPGSEGTHVVGLNSYRSLDSGMLSAPKGELQTVKQGYLLKRSSGSRGDWKRRFFVLENQGNLYYYRVKGAKPTGSQAYNYGRSYEQNSGMFGRFRSKHNRAASLNDDILGCYTIDLCTSTIKMDAEDTDLRLCFRIISPSKTFTLQAENEAARMDWVNKITGAITSLFNSQFLQQPQYGRENSQKKNLPPIGASLSSQSEDGQKSLRDDLYFKEGGSVSKILRGIPGNDKCAECSASEPEWASLNLGILLCIECSGVHRNLGVHISKVRSITLDVRVWENTILELFDNLGNAYCNSIWEGLLLLDHERVGELHVPVKPCSTDAFQIKEKYIQAKYVEKSLIIREEDIPENPSVSIKIWQAVQAANVREVYRLVVTSTSNLINTKYGDEVHHAADAEGQQHDPEACLKVEETIETERCFRGWSLLHLACLTDSVLMVELLLQFGADVNMCDYHGRTPLHHCITSGKNKLAKFLLRRGARPSVKDAGGLSILERAMEMGAITDEELFIMLAEC